MQTTTKADRIPMLVRSATRRIGKTPASTAAATPAIQVTRCGVPRWSVAANQRGRRPSRLIVNQTRVTPSRKVSMTVMIEMTANAEMTVAMMGSPTDVNATAKPASVSICVQFCMPVSTSVAAK